MHACGSRGALMGACVGLALGLRRARVQLSWGWRGALILEFLGRANATMGHGWDSSGAHVGLARCSRRAPAGLARLAWGSLRAGEGLAWGSKSRSRQAWSALDKRTDSTGHACAKNARRRQALPALNTHGVDRRCLRSKTLGVDRPCLRSTRTESTNSSCAQQKYGVDRPCSR